MDVIAVYASQNSPRLKYVLDWLLKERMGLDYAMVTDKKDLEGKPIAIAYGQPGGDCISIPAQGLLWQTGTHEPRPETGMWNGLPMLFPLAAEGCTLPFDLFSAIFFLLSRYEEYYAFTPDKHGRYPATESILYRKGWLARPIVDEWVHALRKMLAAYPGYITGGHGFTYQPTYDIDIAYSHLHKGMGRIAGAYLRALIKMDVGQISERIQVLKNKQKDPYDSFRWLRQLHKQYDYSPIYFILSAEKTSPFDKNIHPRHPAMMRVIKNLSKEGEIGIHPSYFSDRKDITGKEKAQLEQVSGRIITRSRQHYIKVKMPDTYHLLLKNGITDDYSMGYGAHLGFRSGTGSPFYWYDLEKETITKIRIHPFCFMDTTAHYELKLTAAQAFEKLEDMSKLLQHTESTLVTVFHNFSLGTAAEWKGWRQAYEHFLQEKATAIIPGTYAI